MLPACRRTVIATLHQKILDHAFRLLRNREATRKFNCLATTRSTSLLFISNYCRLSLSASGEASCSRPPSPPHSDGPAALVSTQSALQRGAWVYNVSSPATLARWHSGRRRKQAQITPLLPVRLPVLFSGTTLRLTSHLTLVLPRHLPVRCQCALSKFAPSLAVQ